MSTQFDVIRHRIIEEHNLDQLQINSAKQVSKSDVIYKNAAKLLSNETGTPIDYTKSSLFTSLGLTTTGKVVTKVIFIAKTDNGTTFSTVKISSVSDSLPIYPPEGYRLVEGNKTITSNIKQEVEDFTLSVAANASVECQIEWYEV